MVLYIYIQTRRTPNKKPWTAQNTVKTAEVLILSIRWPTHGCITIVNQQKRKDDGRFFQKNAGHISIQRVLAILSE